MKTRTRKITEAALLTVGVACLGIWGWATARESLYEDWQNWIFDRQQAGQGATVGDYLKEKFSGPGTRSEDAEQNSNVAPQAVQRESDPNLLGRLRIPRLKLQAVVREGTGEKTLSLALGHVAGTAKPGQNGNVGVAGHRDRLFRGLRDIRLNDQIVFETSAGDTYVYRVSSTRIVKPTEVSVLNAGVYPELTLITCYPFNYIGSAPERFIVKARQIGQTTREVNPAEIATEAPPARDVDEQREPLATVAEKPKPAPVRAQTPADEERTGRSRRVSFEVPVHHSRQLVPGVSIGLTGTDPERKTVDGWMWVMPERRTIWLRDQSLRQPIVFYGEGGEKREVVIDSVTPGSMRGYLL